MRKLIITISIILLAFIVLVYAENIRDVLHIQPNADNAKTLMVRDADAVEVFSVNTSTAGVVVTGTQSVSGRTTLSGALTGNAAIRGTNVFTTTAEVDTVVISGLLATDFVFVTCEYLGGVDQQDVLQAEIKADTLIVHRLAAGESAGVYNYLIIR